MNKFRLYIISLGILLSGVITANLFNSGASAAVDSSPDCDNVAVIRCGAFSQRALREKAAREDVPRVYEEFGINQNELSGMVNGIVWRDGRATINDRVVATGASTAGRNFGGTPISGTNNVGEYPASRLTSEGDAAFVKMVNGQFDFAVIKSCGNPVRATPARTSTTKVAPTRTRETVETIPVSRPTEPTRVQCDGIFVTQVGPMRYRLTATATATGDATIDTYEFGFGDGYGITVGDNSYTYSYKRPGTYEVSVVPHAIINGAEQTVRSAECIKTLTVGRAERVAACVDTVSDTTPTDQCPTENVMAIGTTRETIPPIEVCEISTRRVVMIDETAYNTAVYSRNVDDCQIATTVGPTVTTPPAPTAIEVCEPSTNDVITIDRNEFDATRHSYAIGNCTETTKLLPSTGPTTIAASLVGSSVLGYGTLAYLRSRRHLTNTLLGR